VTYRKLLAGKGAETLAARLRKERKTMEAKQRDRGKTDGAQWAQSSGGFEALEGLRQIVAEFEDRTLGRDEYFYSAVVEFGRDYSLDDYWSEVRVAREAYIDGFVDGAVEAYEKALEAGSEQ
jgi:hypothetical protein